PETLDQAAARAANGAANKASLKANEDLLAAGVCREQARGVLSQNLMTTFWGTVDLSNLLKFIELRSSQHAQWEIRQYSDAIKELITPVIPNVAKVMGW
ncbi:MAG: FAD-dependent thymidylate synthase, partial [Victivallales bacterium]|nr:FAD-dependent thymidylate synthase [Victivallales bacterium]